MTATFYILIVLGAFMVPCVTDEVTKASVALISAADNYSSAVSDVGFSSSVSSAMSAVMGPSAGAITNDYTISPDLSVPNISTEAGTQNDPTTVEQTGEDQPTELLPPAASEYSSTHSSTTHSTIQSTVTSKHGLTNDNGKLASSAFFSIFIVVFMCLGAALTFYIIHRKQKKFSLDLHGKIEDAQIPLSDAEPEVFESHSPKDMQTFSTVEASSPKEGMESPDGEKGVTCYKFTNPSDV